MKLDNLAVVFIGTDKYLKFLPKWYQTCEEKLLPSVDKQYFVFTDGDLQGTPENISLYKQEHLPWPFITLLRFSTILKAIDELSKYDAIIFDPPRSGAKKQVEEIVKNGPTKVVAVSCNPNTFARDSKILVDGGYELKKITPIDQFLWSPHVELVAEFYREK